MDYTSDIAKLRAEGVSDEDILETYKQIAPNHSSDIDKLRGEGANASDILETVVSLGASPQAPKPQEEDGIVRKSLKALQHGAADAAAGLGSSYRNASGAGGEGRNFLERSSDQWRPDNYKPASKDFFDPQGDDKGLGGYGWGYLPRTVLESLPGLGMDLGGLALAGPAGLMASNAARNFGPTVDSRVANNGGKVGEVSPTGTDLAVGAGNAALQAYLNKVGIAGGAGLSGAATSVAKDIGAEGVKNVGKAVGKAAAVEGGTSVAGDVVDQTMKTTGTEKGFDVNLHEVGGAGILGGATGAGIRGAKGVGDGFNIYRNRNVDRDSAIRVADELEGLDNGIRNGKEQLQALETVEQSVTTRLNRTTQDAKWMFEEAGNIDLLDNVRAALDNGDLLTNKQKESLSSVLEGHENGQALLNGLIDRETVNRIRKRGTVTKQHGFFGDEVFEGGIVGKVGNFIDPRRLIAIAGAGAASAGKLDMGYLSQLGMAGALPAKIAATQAGIYAGARGIDNLTGLSNPVARFRDQFSGLEGGPAKAPNGTMLSPKEAKELENANKQTEQIARKQEAELRKDEADRARAEKDHEKLEKSIAKDEQAELKALAQRRKQIEDSWLKQNIEIGRAHV